MNSYFEKYMKYKNKYSELYQKKIKNEWWMRDQLVLINTLVLLTRYPYTIAMISI